MNTDKINAAIRPNFIPCNLTSDVDGRAAAGLAVVDAVTPDGAAAAGLAVVDAFTPGHNGPVGRFGLQSTSNFSPWWQSPWTRGSSSVPVPLHSSLSNSSSITLELVHDLARYDFPPSTRQVPPMKSMFASFSSASVLQSSPCPNANRSHAGLSQCPPTIVTPVTFRLAKNTDASTLSPEQSFEEANVLTITSEFAVPSLHRACAEPPLAKYVSGMQTPTGIFEVCPSAFSAYLAFHPVIDTYLQSAISFLQIRSQLTLGTNTFGFINYNCIITYYEC